MRKLIPLLVLASVLVLPGSASALSLMVEDMGTPGTALNASAHDTARYMGAQYRRAAAIRSRRRSWHWGTRSGIE